MLWYGIEPKSTKVSHFLWNISLKHGRRHFTAKPTRFRPPTSLRRVQLDKALKPGRIAIFLSAIGVGLLVYHEKDVEKAAIATLRSSRIAFAAALCALDYKSTFSKTFSSEDERLQAYSACHTRSAEKILSALLANGGIFIKLVRTCPTYF